MLRGWKRASEIPDEHVRFRFLMKLSEASFRISKPRQAFAVLNSIEGPPKNDDLLAFQVMRKVGKFRGGKDKGAGTHGKVHDEKKVVNFTSSAQLATCRRHPGLQLCSFGAERLIIQMPRTPRPTIPPADHWPESFLGIASPAVAAAGFKQLRAWRAVRIELCELPATVNEGAGQEVRQIWSKVFGRRIWSSYPSLGLVPPSCVEKVLE
eukprot:s1187_g2.t1